MLLLFLIDQWHALSGDVAPNPNLPPDPFETISLEIGLLSTSTMLFLHQHPLTVNFISLFKNHPIFFWRNGWSTSPPHMFHPQATNISHRQKRKIIFQSDLIVSSMMVVSLNTVDGRNPAHHLLHIWNPMKPWGKNSQYQLVSWSPDFWLPSTVSLGGS